MLLMATWDSVGPPVIYITDFLLMAIDIVLIFNIICNIRMGTVLQMSLYICWLLTWEAVSVKWNFRSKVKC